MVKQILHIILLLMTVQVVAQENLDADRPGETKTPELVKGNHLQVELGFRKEKLSEQQFLYQHPSAGVRFGLFNAIELRMDVISQTIRDEVNKETLHGLPP